MTVNTSKTSRPKLVFIHGWGLNSAIWQPLIEQLNPEFDCLSIDMPGYGKNSDNRCPDTIDELSDALLESAPDNAHWCAWSLGGMAALNLARNESDRFKSINLICSTPLFIKTPKWPIGMDMESFQTFADQLKSNYIKGIQQFLLLQAGPGPQARQLAKKAASLLKSYPEPSAETLQAGLEILKHTDLSDALSEINVPCQIISGQRDRIVHPHSGKHLSQILPNSTYCTINSGHAPHLSNTEELGLIIKKHCNAIDDDLL